MADPTELGSRLKAIRVDRGLTRETVAAKLGCHKTNVAHIEANRQQPSVEQFRILARLYDCSMEDLLEGPLPYLEARPLEQVEQVEPDDDWASGKHKTREMTHEQIAAGLARHEVSEVEEALRRRGVELTDEQRRQLAAKAEAEAA